MRYHDVDTGLYPYFPMRCRFVMRMYACYAGMIVGLLDVASTHSDVDQQLHLQPTLTYAGQPGHGAERVHGNDQPPDIHPSAMPQAGDSLGLVPQRTEEGQAPNSQRPASSRHTDEWLEPVLQRCEKVLQGLTSNADQRQQSETGASKRMQRLEERMGSIETQLDQLQGDPKVSQCSHFSLLLIEF